MKCPEAPAVIVEALTPGIITGTLGRTAIVPVAPQRRNTRDWPEVMVAGEIQTESTTVIAVWACAMKGGPIFAVDGAAREFSTWAAAARGDSRAGATKNMFAEYPETETARRCLAESTGPPGHRE
jgi:hypothetical protein